jgi:hypothetical protein
MTVKTAETNPYVRPALMADMMRYGVVFQADPNPGDEGDKGDGEEKPEPKPKPKAKTPPAREDDGDPAADPAAEALRAQVAALEAKLRGFGDATPDEIKELREVRKRAQKAEDDAKAAAAKAEEERLRKEGDFDTLRQRMAEEHAREIEAVKNQSVELNSSVAALQAQIEDMALTTAFASSPFVAQDTIIGADKARRIYGAHFDVIDGEVVGFDAPRGSAKRVMLVDAQGRSLPFNEAIKRLVDSDPDKDRLLKTQQKPGPGATPNPGVRPQTEQNVATGAARLAKTLPNWLKTA